LEEYLQAFAYTLSVMQTAESLERITFELAQDMANDGVRYLEIRFAPYLHTTKARESN
jgi:adenosine deaminase